MKCPHCHLHINSRLVRKAAAKMNRATQKEPPNPKVLSPCPHCGELKGAREMRLHKPVCVKNPHPRVRGTK
jgi:hypothetical protein